MEALRITSLNVGKPQTVEYNGRQVRTAIFKEPVQGPLTLQGDNFDGDQQADLRVHGGAYKAVYAYAAEYYPLWQSQLGLAELAWGAFGENLTVSGPFYEHQIAIGDVFALGSARLKAVQPRFPCYKLNIRFNRPDMVSRFNTEALWGVYFSIEQHGTVSPGDSMECIQAHPQRLTIAQVGQLVMDKSPEVDNLQRAAAHPDLAPNLKESFQKALAKKKDAD